MFLKELFEDRNDDLTKVNWPPKTGEDAYQSGDVYKQRTRKDESKPTSVVPLLQNWVERNNATGEGAQILYALVKHLESSDPGIVEKVLNFIKGSEGMDEDVSTDQAVKFMNTGKTRVGSGFHKKTEPGAVHKQKDMSDSDIVKGRSSKFTPVQKSLNKQGEWTGNYKEVDPNKPFTTAGPRYSVGGGYTTGSKRKYQNWKKSQKMGEGLRIEPRGKPYVGGVTDVEKAAGAGKPTNQGQTDVEKGTMADVDRTNMPVQKPSRKKPIKSSGRDE
jgi:hypothetical protein